MADSGRHVTQIHTRDNREGIWEAMNCSAPIIGNGESDYFVTGDGVRHDI